RDFRDLFATESAATVRDYLDHVARGGIASVIDGGRQDGGRQVIGRVRQGGSIALFMTMGRLGDAGKLCAIFCDITAWSKSEQALIAAPRAAEPASRAKSDLLARITHD